MQVHIRMYIHIHTNTHPHLHTSTHPHIHMHTSTHTHTHTHILTHTYSSVFDGMPIPYPKRKFLSDDDSKDDKTDANKVYLPYS